MVTSLEINELSNWLKEEVSYILSKYGTCKALETLISCLNEIMIDYDDNSIITIIIERNYFLVNKLGYKK